MVAELEAEVARLKTIIEAQAALITELRSRLEELQSRLEADSDTTSLPPSRDRTDRRARRAEQAKARRQERKDAQAARRPGKQPGAPGSTLCRRTPNHTVPHRPTICPGCGGGLQDAEEVATATRQVLEIPEPALVATDHVVLTLRCCCGALARGEFPPEATGPVCWGPRARAVAAYLLAFQHGPLERTGEAMADLFAAPMGEGTLAGLLPEAAGRLGEFMDRVAEGIRIAPVVHADETTVRVGVHLGWVHDASTPTLTYLAVDEHRGIEGIAAIGVLTRATGTIVHDGLATYDADELSGAGHAQCHAHLVRTLKELAAHDSQYPWATAMKNQLYEARARSEEAAAAGLPTVPADIAEPIRTRYHEILDQAFAWLPGDVAPPRRHTGGWTNAERDAWNLATRMRRHAGQVLALLVDTRIPADNNEAERQLRMSKLHDKISGHFRSWANARAFCTVRSYLQTGRKQGERAIDLLVRLWSPEGAWLPSVVGPDTS